MNYLKRFNRKCKIKMEKKFIPVEFTKMDSVENIIKVNEEHSMWNKDTDINYKERFK